MRIGIDCRLWKQSGVGRYTRNLVLNLQKIDKKNEYVLFVRSEDFEFIKKQIVNKKWRIKPVDVSWHSISEQIKFPFILNKEDLDLVHFPYVSVPIFYGRPFVVTIHDLIPMSFPTGKASTHSTPSYFVKFLSYRFIIRMASMNAKTIITPSNASKEEIINHLRVSNQKIQVIPEAADEKIPQLKSRILKEKYFLYVGNAYPHKNLDSLISAFNEFLKENKNIKLILVGKKDIFYQRLEENNQSRNIVFFGQATDEELGSLYSGAIALIQPSLMEGFGLPVLEAMANKCLVICSDIPSLREVAGEFAIYFNPKDVNDIVNNMQSALSDKINKEEIIQNAYERSKEFSWEKMARETLKVYESCFSLR